MTAIKWSLHNMVDMNYYRYDVSHATRDKGGSVNALCRGLKRIGVRVWYDAEAIAWGDEWEKNINEGLKNCRHGIVVLSPNYFGREWTEKELRELSMLRQQCIVRMIASEKIGDVEKKTGLTRSTLSRYCDSMRDN